MKTTCPKCKTTYDIRDAAVLKAAGTITARRRRRNGNTLTSDEARAVQAKSVEARLARKTENDNAG